MSLVPGATLTALEGFAVGHWSDPVARTGCTVILPPEGNRASGAVRGSAPGSREIALLAPEKGVAGIDALLFAGGSAFGLDAASGVARWLERAGRGFATPHGRVPIVPAAVLYDLGVGRADVRPDAAAGEAACAAAGSGPVAEGAVGVGCGATVGKLLGSERAAPGGVGSAVLQVGEVRVAALAVSNAAGNLVDPADGSRVAGPDLDYRALAERLVPPLGANTTLVAVATDAALDKAACRQLAEAAHVGIARVTRPSHTAHDGDSAFVIASGAAGAALSLAALGVATQEVVAEALLRGVRAAAAGSAA